MSKRFFYLLLFFVGTTILTAEGEEKPKLFIFVGKDWCPWSQKLVEEILEEEDFMLSLKETFQVKRIDVSRSDEDALTKKYQIEQVPTFLLTDSNEEELLRVGYLPKSSLEMAEHLKQIFARSYTLQELLKKPSLAEFPVEKIRHDYLEAKAIGFKKVENKLLNFGLEKDPTTFFLLAKYKELISSGNKKLKVRDLIEQRDPDNKEGALQLAILDFQAQQEFVTNPHKAVKPLKKYLKIFGEKDLHNKWRIEMMLAHYFLGKHEKKEALEYAKNARETAPLQAQEEIQAMIDYICEEP